ncbi:MAG TPA: Rid family detoxifying hydrolase [Candidatus Limnocylindrales bacterium]
MPADRTPVSAQGAPRPGGPYSHAIRTAGPLLFLAGQVPIDPATNQQVGGPIEQQAGQALENLRTVAAAAGGRLEDAVSVRVFLADMADFPGLNEVYRRYFAEPFPARTTIQSNLPGFAVEIDAVIALPPEAT